MITPQSFVMMALIVTGLRGALLVIMGSTQMSRSFENRLAYGAADALVGLIVIGVTIAMAFVDF